MVKATPSVSSEPTILLYNKLSALGCTLPQTLRPYSLGTIHPSSGRMWVLQMEF